MDESYHLECNDHPHDDANPSSRSSIKGREEDCLPGDVLVIIKSMYLSTAFNELPNFGRPEKPEALHSLSDSTWAVISDEFTRFRVRLWPNNLQLVLLLGILLPLGIIPGFYMMDQNDGTRPAALYMSLAFVTSIVAIWLVFKLLGFYLNRIEGAMVQKCQMLSPAVETEGYYIEYTSNHRNPLGSHVLRFRPVILPRSNTMSTELPMNEKDTKLASFEYVGTFLLFGLFVQVFSMVMAIRRSQ